MSELRGRRGLPAMSAVDGDVRAAADAGASGRCLAREMQAIPLVEAARPRRVPGLAAPPLHDPPGLLAIGERMLHHYLTHSPRMPGRVMRGIEERRRLFVEGCRAREAAFDAEPPELRPDALAFALALAAQDARGPPGDRARAGRGAAAGTGRGCGSEATIGAGGARGPSLGTACLPTFCIRYKLAQPRAERLETGHPGVAADRPKDLSVTDSGPVDCVDLST
ncbi:LOW QUALITY PROTEIN: EP300-interacting inhibitor of differentiation 2B [Thomomys bottae]